MARSFSFAEVETALAGQVGLPARLLPTFRERIRRFNRLGLLGEISKGRGKAAQYAAEHIILLALAFELAELGVPAERATSILRTVRLKVAVAVDHAMSIQDDSIYLLLDPDGLSAYRDSPPPAPGQEAAFAAATDAEKDIAVRTFTYVEGARLPEVLIDQLEAVPHAAVINLSRLLTNLDASISAAVGEPADESFFACAGEWTEQALAGRPDRDLRFPDGDD